MSNRRTFIQRAMALGATIFAAPNIFATQHQHSSHPQTSGKSGAPPHSTSQSISVHTPDVADLPFRLDNGVKEFHLIAEPVKQEVIPGRVLNLWGFNGSAPGPTIQINQGDRVRIIVDNHLPEPFSMHWHGFEIPHEMDGAPGTSQDPIKPGDRFVYEFTLHQEGTFFYHSHMAMQEMMGMLGGFIMHPKQAYQPHVDKDFLILLQEYAVLPNNAVPNSMNMEFNWLTFNGKVGPATTPLIVRLGDRVRIRLVNLGMDHHPIHLHGHTFATTGTEAGRQPQTIWGTGNTVLVGVAQARDIEFIANNPGDWMVHCHLPHHMMNAMSSVVGRMTRGRAGLPAGAGMEEGMGIIREGNATSEDNGPSLGRGMGVGATMDERTTNGPLSTNKAQTLMPEMQHGENSGTQHGQMQMEPEVAVDANRVPGFPQDAYMEGPMMAMDQMVDKPENYGLKRGWSQFMQGMMTFVRVLPPDKYDEITSRIQQKRPNQKSMPDMEHHEHGS
jgi:FtsP/CotA-like multicopper oxidase with cupredoxin domain